MPGLPDRRRRPGSRGASIGPTSRRTSAHLQYAVEVCPAAAGRRPARSARQPSLERGGRALAITGFSLEASGPGADRYAISAGDHLPWALRRCGVTGNRIVVSGPSGRGPLVGLKLYLEEHRAQSAPLAPMQPGQTEPANPVPRLEGRVRVFRAVQAPSRRRADDAGSQGVI